MDHSRPADKIPQNRLPQPSDGVSVIGKRLESLILAVGRRYENCSLESYEISEDESVRKKQVAVIARLNAYAAEMKKNVNSGCCIAMFGVVGTGKDHLLVSMLKKVIELGASVEFRDGMSLAREFRNTVTGESSEGRLIGKLTSCHVLAISEPIPPAGSLSEFSREKLLSVIDRRYRDKRPTWVTMNVASREEAEIRMSPQIVDRLTDEALCLSFDWPSYRLSRRWVEGDQ